MTSAQPGQEQRMELKPCRACGSDCRIEHFEGRHIQGVMTVYVCAENAKFGGDCPDEYAYLSEEVWNTRPTADLGEDGERYPHELRVSFVGGKPVRAIIEGVEFLPAAGLGGEDGDIVADLRVHAWDDCGGQPPATHIAIQAADLSCIGRRWSGSSGTFAEAAREIERALFCLGVGDRRYFGQPILTL